MSKEFRVVTSDTYVWADSAEEAVEIASHDMGARVYAEETGLISNEEDEA